MTLAKPDGAEYPVCDLCFAPNPQYSYPAQDFILRDRDSTPIFGSAGGRWTACSACASLIDAKKWEELAERVVKHFCAKFPDYCDNEEKLRTTRLMARYAIENFKAAALAVDWRMQKRRT
jgi:hypothetical protein